jgi:hypothetical protein
MAQVPLPKPGCFTSSYPNTGWQEVPCVTPPPVPNPPASGLRPETIGNGHDASAQVTGHISTAIGSFDSVTGVTSEVGSGNPNDGIADAFTLQLNSNYFSNSPPCSGAQVPAGCLGWQQFVHSNYQGHSAYMQYWLLNYYNPCPTAWFTYSPHCFTNSPAVSVPLQPITNLGNMTLTGKAVTSGMDAVILSTGNTLYAVQNADSMVGLANFWTGTEFNIFGDCCGTGASFNPGSTIVVRTTVDSGVTIAPSCSSEGFTGETNNLFFQPASGTPRSSTQPSIIFTQSSNTTATLPCQSAVAVPAASKLVDTHDSNGDGLSDIVWRDTSGNVAIWLMNGAQVKLSAVAGTAPPATWSIVGHRDFNGDGTYDLLWRDTSGNTSMWFMLGTQVFSSASVGNIPTTWSVVGVADFNGDGKGDLLWRDSSGNTAVWLMNGASVLSTGSLGNIPTTWSVAGTGDFNADGKADILWRDGSGNTSIWFMNGTAVSSTAEVGNVSMTWSVVGTGDFNGDGKTDITWRDSTGSIGIWLMNGASVLSTGIIGIVPTAWSLALTGDFNGDGRSDLLWRDTSGNTAIWFMNGMSVSSSQSVGNISTTWTVQTTNAD